MPFYVRDNVRFSLSRGDCLATVLKLVAVQSFAWQLIQFVSLCPHLQRVQSLLPVHSQHLFFLASTEYRKQDHMSQELTQWTFSAHIRICSMQGHFVLLISKWTDISETWSDTFCPRIIASRERNELSCVSLLSTVIHFQPPFRVSKMMSHLICIKI